MVLLMGGYSLKIQDAKAWAQRHWPGIVFHNNERLEIPLDIMRHNRQLGGNMRCILAKVDNEFQCLFVVHEREDSRATPFRFKAFPESRLALKFKSLAFEGEKHGDLTERIKWTTIADPFLDWTLVGFHTYE